MNTDKEIKAYEQGVADERHRVGNALQPIVFEYPTIASKLIEITRITSKTKPSPQGSTHNQIIEEKHDSRNKECRKDAWTDSVGASVCTCPPQMGKSMPTEEWRKKLEDFASINEMYIRGFPMGKLEQFIAEVQTSADQAGYNRAMGEARDKIEDDKKKCYGADGHFFTEGWKWTAMGYDNALNILRSLTTTEVQTCGQVHPEHDIFHPEGHPTDNNKEV